MTQAAVDRRAPRPARAAASDFRGRRPAGDRFRFLPVSVLLNSRFGRDAEEILADSAVRLWRELVLDVIPGLFRLILATFDGILEAIDRLLYAVDEWLRFRSGQRRGGARLQGRGGLGLVLRGLPRAHLRQPPDRAAAQPDQTLSGGDGLAQDHPPRVVPSDPDPGGTFAPLGPKLALYIAGTTVLLLPGVFGFLVWELKENWRLYEANRAAGLKPVVVGDHGESMRTLLRPGIHSGTLPKLFAKLRKSERRARRRRRRR